MVLTDTAIAALSIDEQRAFTYSTPEEAAVVANHARQDAAEAQRWAIEDAEEAAFAAREAESLLAHRWAV